MTRLVDPHVRYQAGYLAASDEFARSGEQRDGDGYLAQQASPGSAGYTFTLYLIRSCGCLRSPLG